MSCTSFSQQPVRLNVTIGALPEGFCPDNLQDMLQAFADRLIITPSQQFSTFVVGSVAPTSNQGPWFKDCEVWYVWNDSTATYEPMRAPQFNNTVGAYRAYEVMPADLPIGTDWTDACSVVTPQTTGGIVQVSAQGVITFTASGSPDQFAMRVTDGTNEWPIVLDIPQSSADVMFVPFSINFTDTPVGGGVSTTYTLQVSAKIAPFGTLLETATKGNKTVNGITRIDLVQFVIPT